MTELSETSVLSQRAVYSDVRTEILQLWYSSARADKALTSLAFRVQTYVERRRPQRDQHEEVASS